MKYRVTLIQTVRHSYIVDAEDGDMAFLLANERRYNGENGAVDSEWDDEAAEVEELV